MESTKEHNLAIAALGAWWLLRVVAPAKVVQYGRAAQRDERNGFPYTAAMQWRKAAELFAPDSRVADYCWREWERIMHLPRRLAEPIWESRAASVPGRMPLAVEPSVKKVSFATAA